MIIPAIKFIVPTNSVPENISFKKFFTVYQPPFLFFAFSGRRAVESIVPSIKKFLRSKKLSETNEQTFYAVLGDAVSHTSK
jgi:ubiquinone/menaquinone biosynthesis C-methylase UbiE